MTEHNPLFYQTRKQLPFIEKTEGIYMTDHTGKTYIDGCSGAIICNIGYGNQKVIQRINEQAEKTFFAYRTHFENRPALDLANRLVGKLSGGLNKVFYVSGGSEAVETALKICRQYCCSIGEKGRHLFVSRKPSYHGCTLGALGITSYAPLEAPFKPMVKNNPRIPAPFCYRCAFDLEYPKCGVKCATVLEDAIEANGAENIAAFVAEPIGGASTAATVPPDEYFSIIRNICDKYGIMLILDEVMTAFGRTGRFFGYEHFGVKADVIALSKGMASGYFPLGAAVTTEKIVDAILDGGGFQHGHTYAGNPMACAVGEAVFDTIEEKNLVENSAKVGAYLKEGLERLKTSHRIIGDVRGKGMLLGIELVQDRETKAVFDPARNANFTLADHAYENGLILYPRRPINGLRGDHLLVAPPLITTKEEADIILDRLDTALERTETRLFG
jgi:adenosylmethionine-8-amino-7-oxononanoate aminotransferase